MLDRHGISACCLLFFFFNDTATTEIYTLSLHDALPILLHRSSGEEAGRHEGGEDFSGYPEARLPGTRRNAALLAKLSLRSGLPERRIARQPSPVDSLERVEGLHRIRKGFCSIRDGVRLSGRGRPGNDEGGDTGIGPPHPERSDGTPQQAGRGDGAADPFSGGALPPGGKV